MKQPEEVVPGNFWVNNNTAYIDHNEKIELKDITFRVINNIKLVIWIPERIVDKKNIRDLTLKIYKEADFYVRWFEKKFRCRLGFPQLYQDYHITFQENDPFLCELVKKHGLLKIVDSEDNVIAWWDQSKVYSEYETRDERIAEARAFAPYKIIWLEDKIRNIENNLEEKIKIIFEEKIGPIIEEKIAAIVQKEFSRFFNQPKKSDNFEDVV